MKYVCLLFLIMSCAILKPMPSIDDPLLEFYKSAPAPQTHASLKATEKGRASIRAHELDQAIDQLNRALVIDPDNPFAYYFLALAYHEKGEYKKSNGFLDKAKQLLTPFPFWKSEAYELSAQNWEKLGNTARSQSNYQKAEEIRKKP